MNPTLHPFTRGIFAALFTLGFLVSLHAGNIAGHAIAVNTGTVLAGVSVRVQPGNRTAITDVNGRFRVSNLEPGDYTVEASYINYEDVVQQVAVPLTGDVTTTLQFGSEILLLGHMVVEGYREGWSKALQQKKTSQNFTDIISADSVGNLPDRNVADALSRLPGVSLLADSGEGQFVSIRGMNPNLNNITLNGATLASSGIRNLDGRDSVSGSVVPLDVIGSANISQLELIKTLTPDMDASAIGGTINLRTPSAFDRKGQFIHGSISSGQSDLAKKTIYDGVITYGNRFGSDDKIGVALSANHSSRPFRTEAFQSVWGPAGFGDARYVPLALELLPEEAKRKRTGLTGNFEIRPNDDVHYYLKTVFNRLDETNLRQEAITRTNNVRGSFDGNSAVVFDNTRAEHRIYKTVTEQTQLNATAGMLRDFNILKLETELSFSSGRQDRPEMKSIQFRNPNINAVPGFRIEYAEFIPNISRGVSDFANAARFPLRIYDERQVDVSEDIATARIDLTIDLRKNADRGLTLKTGAKYLNNERNVLVNVLSYGGSFNLASTEAAIPGQNVMGKHTGIDIDYARAISFIESNRHLLTEDRGASRSGSAANTFDVEQKILAGYAMGTVALGRLTLLGGLRYESTEADINALEYRTMGTAVGTIVPNQADFSYTNMMPNAQVRYELSPQWVLRGAFTSTIRRPEYEFAAPASRLQLNAFSGGGTVAIVDPVNFPNIGLLTVGNPDLKPYESINYDVALEHYLKSGGLISIAAFQKNIENPIYQTIELRTNTVYNEIGFQELQISSYQNAKDGRVRGVEFYVQLPLTFLPSLFDGLGLDANLTVVSSSVQVFSRPGVKMQLFEQPDKAVNIAIYYHRGRFNARFAYNYQDSSLRQIGATSAADFYRADRYQTDAQASYRISEQFTLYANVQNITDQPQDTFQGQPDRLRYRRSFGSVYQAGLRFQF
jgi:TonB-dependent receptor